MTMSAAEVRGQSPQQLERGVPLSSGDRNSLSFPVIAGVIIHVTAYYGFPRDETAECCSGQLRSLIDRPYIASAVLNQHGLYPE